MRRIKLADIDPTTMEVFADTIREQFNAYLPKDQNYGKWVNVLVKVLGRTNMGLYELSSIKIWDSEYEDAA